LIGTPSLSPTGRLPFIYAQQYRYAREHAKGTVNDLASSAGFLFLEIQLKQAFHDGAPPRTSFALLAGWSPA